MKIGGELTRAQIPGLMGRLSEFATDGQVDLADVSRADSAGLALLLEIARGARSQGQSVAFVNAPQQLRKLAHFFGLDTALQFE